MLYSTSTIDGARMKLGRIIGTVVTVREVNQYQGCKLLLVQEVDENNKDIGEPLVAIDTVDTGVGSQVFFVTAREAAMAIPGRSIPTDAAIVGIVEEAR
jgi:ethanolamine utilization protein EutN